MADSEDTVLGLVSKVYDAALDGQKWPSFLESFMHVIGGGSSILRTTDFTKSTTGFVASAGYDPGWRDAYCSYFIKLDYLTPALNRFGVADANPGENAMQMSEQRKTEFFNDFCRPQGMLHVLGTRLATDGSYTLTFTVQRGKRAGAFGEEEVRLMNMLAPHVTRAVQVHRRLGSIVGEKEWALAALDHLRVGVILTDCFGVPLFANRAAEQMMAAGKGIGLCQRRLDLNNLPETALLHKLIAAAAQGAATGGDMRIALHNKTEFLQCTVMPVSPELSVRLGTPTGSGCAAVFLSKPGSVHLPPERLAILYGLSPAESRLAAKLAAFNSLEEAANELAIAIGTARTQLAAVFSKTGAKSQAELLMLLATGALAHRREE